MDIKSILFVVWDKLQFGFDVVLPLVAIWLVYKWIRESRQKYEESQRKQLSASVRSAAASRLQEALHTLSHQYMFGVAKPLNRPSNIAKGGVEDVAKRFERGVGLFDEMLQQFEGVQAGVLKFIEDVHVAKYQIYPLLDALGNEEVIGQFRVELSELVDLFNQINVSSISLMRELNGVLEFCQKNEWEGLASEQHESLLRLTASIMYDKDYAYWVNSFIPDEDEKAYWDWTSPRSEEVRKSGILLFIQTAYGNRSILMAHVFKSAVGRYVDVQTKCKKFLVVLAAINHALLSRESEVWSGKMLSELIERYEGQDFFALDSEVR